MSVTFTPRGVESVAGPYGAEPAVYCNFAVGNAGRLLALAGLVPEPYGDFPCADLPVVAQRLLRALNAQEVFTREASSSQVPGRCRVIECGTSEESERIRIRSLLQVVKACIERGVDLVWD